MELKIRGFDSLSSGERTGKSPNFYYVVSRNDEFNTDLRVALKGQAVVVEVFR